MRESLFVCVCIPLVEQNEKREIDYQKRGNIAVLFYSRKLKEYLMVKTNVIRPCNKNVKLVKQLL